MLREELSQFLSDNGIFRDVLYYVDVLCAQVYAQYICEQGGSYLRADFSAPEDPMQHTRRLLGLDGVQPGNGRTRLKSIDGEAFLIDSVGEVIYFPGIKAEGDSAAAGSSEQGQNGGDRVTMLASLDQRSGIDADGFSRLNERLR